MTSAACLLLTKQLEYDFWSSWPHDPDGMTAITIILAMSFGLTVPKVVIDSLAEGAKRGRSLERKGPTQMTPPRRGRLERRLPPLLSVVAAWSTHWVLSLGLFTAHHRQPRGDRSSAGARWPTPHGAGPAVPVFIVGVAAVWLIAQSLRQTGPALVRPLLLVQLLLLAGVLILSVSNDPAADPHGLMTVVIAIIAVVAMACHLVCCASP